MSNHDREPRYIIRLAIMFEKTDGESGRKTAPETCNYVTAYESDIIKKICFLRVFFFT